MMTIIVVIVVSAALMAGAAWGLFGKLGRRTEGFLVALAGGALIVSIVSELIEPALERTPTYAALGVVLLGAGLATPFLFHEIVET